METGKPPIEDSCKEWLKEYKQACHAYDEEGDEGGLENHIEKESKRLVDALAHLQALDPNTGWSDEDTVRADLSRNIIRAADTCLLNRQLYQDHCVKLLPINEENYEKRRKHKHALNRMIAEWDALIQEGVPIARKLADKIRRRNGQLRRASSKASIKVPPISGPSGFKALREDDEDPEEDDRKTLLEQMDKYNDKFAGNYVEAAMERRGKRIEEQNRKADQQEALAKTADRA